MAEDTQNQPAPPPSAQMMQLATGHWRSQAVYVAAKLGVADLLVNGPLPVAEIASATRTHAESLYRLLRALASIGVFAEDDDGRFALTPLARTMLGDDAESVRPALLLLGRSFHWNSWSNLLHSVLTGECAFEHVHGMRAFDYFTGNPDDGEAFNAWMTRASGLQLPAILEAFDFSRFGRIADVGGGHGRLLAAVLKANPQAQGILFELPEVIASAAELSEAGVEDKCEKVAGNIFESVPAGADLYMMKTVIHDWSDELSVKILKNCRAAMHGDARVLLIESVVPPGNEPHFSKFMDLNMLVLNHGGKERTEAEYRDLFGAAGLSLMRVIPTRSPMSLIEGAPAA